MVIILTAFLSIPILSSSSSSVVINAACSRNSGNESYFAITSVINSCTLSNLSALSESLESRHISKYPADSNNVRAASRGGISIQLKLNASKKASAAARCFALNCNVRNADIKLGPTARNLSMVDAPNPRRGFAITRMNEISSNGYTNKRRYAIASRISIRS